MRWVTIEFLVTSEWFAELYWRFLQFKGEIYWSLKIESSDFCLAFLYLLLISFFFQGNYVLWMSWTTCAREWNCTVQGLVPSFPTSKEVRIKFLNSSVLCKGLDVLKKMNNAINYPLFNSAFYPLVDCVFNPVNICDDNTRKCWYYCYICPV